jgi:hypothetical protein
MYRVLGVWAATASSTSDTPQIRSSAIKWRTAHRLHKLCHQLHNSGFILAINEHQGRQGAKKMWKMPVCILLSKLLSRLQKREKHKCPGERQLCTQLLELPDGSVQCCHSSYAIHMQCIQFYCNISHKIKGTQMETKCISACYMTKCLWGHLLNEGAKCSLADIISVFHFCPHIVKQPEGNCSHWSSYPHSKFLQSGNQQWEAHRSLMYSQKKKSRRVRSGEWVCSVCLMDFFVLGS